MKDWYDIYLEEIKLKKGFKNYVNYKIKNKKKLIKLIIKYSENKKIMEAGCGTGIISTYMSTLGYDVIGIDINKKILNLAEKISNEYSNNKKTIFLDENIFNLNFDDDEFDVIFSNGVLEHFSDEEIKKTLKKQLDQAKFVIIGIPTTFFNSNEALHGDERFLPLQHWRKLFEESNAYIIEETSYDYRIFKEYLTSYKKIFKPKPFRIFVLKRKDKI